MILILQESSSRTFIITVLPTGEEWKTRSTPKWSRLSQQIRRYLKLFTVNLKRLELSIPLLFVVTPVVFVGKDLKRPSILNSMWELILMKSHWSVHIVKKDLMTEAQWISMFEQFIRISGLIVAQNAISCSPQIRTFWIIKQLTLD